MADFTDRDIDTTVGQFEAALSVRQLEVLHLEVGRALLALDRSNQDQAVLDLGGAVAARLGCPVLLTYAGEVPNDGDALRYLAQRGAALADAGIDAAHANAHDGRAFAQILALAEANACGLIIFPSPYLEDFQDVGRASVGTTTDVLLHRRPAPLLIVRKPAETVRDRLENVVLPLNLVVAEHAAEAAAWTLALVPTGGMIHLLAVVDAEMLATIRSLLGQSWQAADFDESTLAGLGRPDMAGLVAAVQRRAAEAGVDCRLTVRQGALVPTIIEFANAEPHLLVLACGKACVSADYQRTATLIRESTNPVLVV